MYISCNLHETILQRDKQENSVQHLVNSNLHCECSQFVLCDSCQCVSTLVYHANIHIDSYQSMFHLPSHFHTIPPHHKGIYRIHNPKTDQQNPLLSIISIYMTTLLLNMFCHTKNCFYLKYFKVPPLLFFARLLPNMIDGLFGNFILYFFTRTGKNNIYFCVYATQIERKYNI